MQLKDTRGKEERMAQNNRWMDGLQLPFPSSQSRHPLVISRHKILRISPRPRRLRPNAADNHLMNVQLRQCSIGGECPWLIGFAKKLTCSPQREAELLCPHFLWLLSLLALSCTLTLSKRGTESSLFFTESASFQHSHLVSMQLDWRHAVLILLDFSSPQTFRPKCWIFWKIGKKKKTDRFFKLIVQTKM